MYTAPATGVLPGFGSSWIARVIPTIVRQTGGLVPAAAADRVLSREKLGGELLIDDEHLRARIAVGAAEGAAADRVDAGRLEKPLTDDDGADFRPVLPALRHRPS